MRVPVKDIPQFAGWEADELDCLNLNIAVPPKRDGNNAPMPVMVYIHGGAYWFGGNFAPIYDVAALVSHSVKMGQPLLVLSINYRLALGGFLASRQIKEELFNDGHGGNGNFALLDQQVALEWIQKHISQFNGDPDNVTIFGESAGGISVAHQIAAARPSKFKRAIQMSGSLNLIPSWAMERHQQRYDLLCRRFGIDPLSDDTLAQLRTIPADELCAATLWVEPSDFTVYHTCDDGVFHKQRPDLSYGKDLPSWLESIMIGDCTDEGELWRGVVSKHDLSFHMNRMQQHMSSSDIDQILEIYGVTKSSSKDDATQALLDIIADMMFKMQNYVIAHESNVPKTFAYHVDQTSTLENELKGQAYHAIDLLYVFLNGREDMSPSQIRLAEQMASNWINFAHGKDPWERFGERQRWMIYGPKDKQSTWDLQSEEQDESVRRYSRYRQLLEKGLYEKLFNATEDIAYERYRLEELLAAGGELPN